jgi:serine/threonine protein kinase
MNHNNILKQLKPTKILGKGSQGIVILSHDDNYAVKIYTKKVYNLKMLIKIINFFINCKSLPKTIYKSYYLTENMNSLNRYIENNNLPNHFSYNSINNLKILSEKYEMKIRLFEIMKTYNITLKGFIEKIMKNNNINENLRIEIIHSLFYQGLFTLLWLYIKKGILHLDISSDNFFVTETDDKELIIDIKDNTYNVKLYGYYLVISDFGYARSIELIDSDNYKYNYRVNLEELNMHPWRDTNDFIKMFKKYFKELNINNIGIKNNIANSRFNSTKQEYRSMIRSYYKNNEEFKQSKKTFKDEYLKFFIKYICRET